MKENVLETLRKLGFIFKQIDDAGYQFDYEGHHYVFIPSEHDDDFLTICLPCVYEIDEEDELAGYKIIDKLNAGVKYVKAYTRGGDVWLFYENYVAEGIDLEEVVSHMINALHAANEVLIDYIEDDNDDDDDDNDLLIDDDDADDDLELENADDDSDNADLELDDDFFALLEKYMDDDEDSDTDGEDSDEDNVEDNGEDSDEDNNEKVK